jgi:hypothetical protein
MFILLLKRCMNVNCMFRSPCLLVFNKNILRHQSESYLNIVTCSPLATELDLHLKTDTAMSYADCKLIVTVTPV